MTDQTEAAVQAVDRQIAGIGGWLILPAIGFVLGPIVGAASLVLAVTLFSGVRASGYGGLYAVEVLLELGLLVFNVYAAIRFFGKKSNAPSLAISLMIATVVVSGLLLMIELGAGAEAFAIESAKQLARGVVMAAIWIPYFRVSRRVKATFVN